MERVAASPVHIRPGLRDPALGAEPPSGCTGTGLLQTPGRHSPCRGEFWGLSSFAYFLGIS